MTVGKGKASRYKRQLTFQKFGPITDAYGDAVDGYTALPAVWGSVRPSPGLERLANAQTSATSAVLIRVRYTSSSSNLSPKDKIEYPIRTGRMLDIKSVVEIGFRDEIEIVAIGRAS